jgi:CBS domain-containing protein
MRVREFMSAPVLTVREDKHLQAVEEIMAWAHIRHVPVVNASGRLVGILSHRDLLGAAISTLAIKISRAERKQHLAASDVRALMRQPVETIGPDEPVQVAAHRMRAHKIGCLPVIEGDRLIGMLTEADLLGVLERMPLAGSGE